MRDPVPSAKIKLRQFNAVLPTSLEYSWFQIPNAAFDVRWTIERGNKDSKTIRVQEFSAMNSQQKYSRPTKRCGECGAKFKCTHLDESGTCYECALVARTKLEGRIKPEVDNGNCPKMPKTMDHPAIIKSKT